MTSSADASTVAATRVAAAEPTWDAVVSIAEAIPGRERIVLHAGPPFEARDQIPAPIRQSIAAACMLEGWAVDWQAAFRLIDDQTLSVEPAQAHGVMVPLCGVATPTMAAIRVSAPSTRRPFFSVLNEGQAHGTRFGMRDPGLIEHLRWLNGPLATELASALTRPMALFPLLGRSLDAGDDGHSQTAAGSRLVVDLLAATALSPKSTAFLAESPAFALNLWMAAVACALATEQAARSALIVRAGGNGVRFGIQTALAPDAWTSCAAPALSSPPDPPPDDVLPAVGDSALLDLFGLGGQLANGDAPLLAPAPALGGRWIGLSAETLVESAYEPVIRLGMIERTGTRGRLRGGTIAVPHALMRAVVSPLVEAE